MAQLAGDWAMSENIVFEQLPQAKEDVEMAPEGIALLAAALTAADRRVAHPQGQAGHLQVWLDIFMGENAALEDATMLRIKGTRRGEQVAWRMAGI